MHAAYLKYYLDAHIAPKGLQITLKPSMTVLSQSELERWNTVLTNASLELVKITIEHCETASTAVKQAERNSLRDRDLAQHETVALKVFEERKRGMLSEVKENKLTGDNVGPPPAVVFERNVRSCRAESHNAVSSSDVELPTRDLPRRACERESQNCIPESTNIVDLSNIELSIHESSLLSRGLNFCPTTGRYDEFFFFCFKT